jgi:hypothetical protein
MPQPVSYNPGTPVSGSIQENSISYVVDGQQRNYRGGFGGLSWMSEVPAENNVIFIGNSTSLGRGPANIPLFYPAYNNSSANIVYAANTLPGSPRNFTTTGSAYNWAVTNNFFINNSNNPIPRIDADGLVLYVDANQPTSYPQINNTWYDLSGQNNVTNLLNGPAWNYNGWIVFDSTDDYADTSINTNALFSSNDPFSVSITIKPTETINANSGLVTNQKYQSEISPGGFGLVTYNTNQVAINLTKNDGTGTVSYEALAPTTLSINSWQNITYTYDPGAGTVTGYKNGTLANSYTSAAYKWTPEARTTWIARNWQGGWNTDFFSSEISNVSIYRKTLSQTEIKQNYFQSNIVQDGLVFMVDANNLVSYPKSGTTLYNLTGSSGNALLYNGPTYVPQYGGGINRDNTDDFISASISNSPTTNYSVETWFKANPQTGTNYNALISAWNYPIGAGGWEFQFYNGALGVHPTYTVAYTPNTVAHAVYTQNGNETKIYLNGVLQQTSTTSGVTLNNGSIGIGNLSAPGYGGYNLEGTFYNVRLYNKTLSASEVQQNYQATKDKFQGQQIVTNGLIFNLDAANKDSYPGTGTAWYDLSGNNYNGTLVNGPTFLPNQNGGIFNFDYVDDYVSIGNNLGSPSTFTLSAWVRSSNISQPQNIFNGNPPFFLRITSSTIRCAVYTGTWIFVNGSITLSSNTWYNLVLTYDQSTVKGYVNGVLDVNSVKTGTPIYGALNTLGFTTGGEDAPSVTNIAVAQIYNRALSATEIAQNYNATKGRFGL